MPTQRSAKPKRATIRAESSAKRIKKPRGKGKRFEPGNPYRFPPGISGNAGGRPKRVTDAYREWLETVSEQAGGLTNAQLLARSMGIESLKGNVSAAGEIRKATEGERIDMTSGGKPLTLALKWEDDSSTDDSNAIPSSRASDSPA